MRAVSVALACTLIPSIAIAENNQDQSPTPAPEARRTDVVGGMDAPLGKWPDAAAILFGGQQQCTGTLIAPTVVITAGHCNSADLDQILVGTNNYSRPADGGGEKINVSRRIVLQQNDITVLVLEKPSVFPPRPLATGWAKLDVKNGAPVAIVGYGATDTQGNVYIPQLQEVMTTIADFDCSTKPGCDNFELGAGGDGIDSCFGDSGGPLYLVTDYGNFLVGVTSRGYATSGPPCGGGGIYGRPDQVVDFIEAAAGVPVTRGPEPTLEEPLIAIRGDAGEAKILHNDPKAGASHTFAITTQPAKGAAAIRADGTLRVCVAADATPGDTESVVVTVTDSADPGRSVASRVTISVAGNEAVPGTCDPNAFGEGEGGGCCDSGGKGAGGSALLSLFALVMFRRRRR